MEPPIIVQPGISTESVPPQVHSLQPNGGCEQGLEPLLGVSKIIVKQHYELLEILAGFETRNRYRIKNEYGQVIYHAYESSSCCNRWLCGDRRRYTIRVIDAEKREVLRMERPFNPFVGNCCACCSCCGDSTEIFHHGKLVGSVQQTMSCYRTHYVVRDGNGEDIFSMTSPNPCFISCCFRRAKNFKYSSIQTGSVVGRISKKFGGFLREIATDADVFGVEFPPDLDVKLKATLMGATFLIDFMHFEKPADPTGRPGRPVGTFECCQFG